MSNETVKPKALAKPPYALVVKHFVAGTHETVPCDDEDTLEKGVEALKANTNSSVVSFDIFIHKETFFKQQVWSSTNA